MSVNGTPVTHKQSSLTDLFKMNLKIPDYQRNYSWESSHVTALLSDTFGRSTEYLMGTVILHQKPCENDNGNTEKIDIFDIVDGQQRLITLTILLKELSCKDVNSPLLENSVFPKSAWWNIKETQKVINNFLKNNPNEKENYLEIIKEKLKFSVLTLTGPNALDLAYTFFDSVNSKGKPLSDFDLLKAHHLMFIPAREESLAEDHNNEWQVRDDRHHHVFTNTLRRLRMWARREDRDSREERADYNEFCDKVEPDKTSNHEYLLNRYMQPAAFRSWRREGGRVVLSMDYPMLDAEELIPTPFLTEHRFVTLKFKHICPRKIKIVNKIRGWLLKSENVVPCFYFCCCFFTPGLLLWLYVYTTDQNEQLVYG